MLVDVKNNCLIDAETKITTSGKLPQMNPTCPNISILIGDSKFDKILSQYSEITNPSKLSKVQFSTIFRFIEMKGPPVYFQTSTAISGTSKSNTGRIQIFDVARDLLPI